MKTQNSKLENQNSKLSNVNALKRPSVLRFAFCVLNFAFLSAFLPGCTSIVAERIEAPNVVGDKSGYIFRYDDISASEVNLAGQFNDFTIKHGDRKEIPMKRGADGLWQVIVPYKESVHNKEYDALDDDIYLEHGNRYKYKIVINQNQWITDPTNPSKVKDPDGNENSLLVAP